mmetsp:Transcript_50077/g.167323  ORF Transcript_50077/g.167323 Transcript_50077/m.167323 type:complete len:240 (+) Transcript_50077:37-756(+)
MEAAIAPAGARARAARAASISAAVGGTPGCGLWHSASTSSPTPQWTPTRAERPRRSLQEAISRGSPSGNARRRVSPERERSASGAPASSGQRDCSPRSSACSRLRCTHVASSCSPNTSSDSSRGGGGRPAAAASAAELASSSSSRRSTPSAIRNESGGGGPPEGRGGGRSAEAAASSCRGVKRNGCASCRSSRCVTEPSGALTAAAPSSCSGGAGCASQSSLARHQSPGGAASASGTRA